MYNEEVKQFREFFKSLPDKISTSKSSMEIPLEVHSEYISYHDKIDRDDYKYEKVIKESEKLFWKNTLSKKNLFFFWPIMELWKVSKL